jgi:hypothetical protein
MKKTEIMSTKHNSRAKRETDKIFLSHIFQYWRQMNGLPVKRPRFNEDSEILSYPKEPYNPTHGGYRCSRGNHYSKIEPIAYIAIENSQLQTNERTPDGSKTNPSKGFKLTETLRY